MRRAVLVLAAALVMPAARAADALTSDISDMWWDSNESGWGMNATLQANVLFLTIYVYSADGKAHWFVAPQMLGDVNAPSDQPVDFSGALYETTGPAFSSAFNPNAVNARMVGTARFEYVTPFNGQLTYTVDGVVVDRRLRRETWAVNDPSGTYAATLVTRSNQCSPGVVTSKNLGTATITLANDLFTMSTSGATPTDNCTFSGNYSQEGRMGSSSGTYSCSASGSGPYTVSEMETGTHGFLARFDGTIAGCHVYGNLAGTRTTVRGASE